MITVWMRQSMAWGGLATVWLQGAAWAERPYVNDLKVPENRQDIEAIQAAVVEVPPQARAATVCIKLKEGSGTGVVVSADGLVLSAAHVTAAVGETVTLVFEDGSEVEAKTLGLDSECDAAMLRITKPERDDWPHVAMDREDSCRLGDWVFALGHSGGFDKERGLVLRVGRLVKMAQVTFFSDCMLIGGDSGGPLFDLNGTLVAIHSRVGNAAQENMHVPMSLFIDSWDELLEGEFLGDGPFAERPVKGNGFLGIATEACNGGGLTITRIGGDGPAGPAGLQTGDVLLQINGQALAHPDDLKAALKELAAGDEVTLDYRRDGRATTLKLKLDER